MASENNESERPEIDIAAILAEWAPEPDHADPDTFVARGVLASFWNGVALEVRTTGKCVIKADLIKSLFENAVGRPPLLNAFDLVAIEKAGARAIHIRRDRTVLFLKHHDSTEWINSGSNYTRASGVVVCACGYMLSDHPMDLEAAFVRVACDGRRVKL